MKRLLAFLAVSLWFVALAHSDGGSTPNGNWSVTVGGGSSVVGTATIDVGAGKITYTPTGGSPVTGTISASGNGHYSFSVGGYSNVDLFIEDGQWTWQDGYGAGPWGNLVPSAVR